jgi:hypothetical protein
MNNENQLNEDEKKLHDFIVSGTMCIRDGWKINDLIKELKFFCKEEEQICARLTDDQVDILNNNPEAFPLVKKNKKGNVIEVAVANPIPTDEHPDKAIVTM